MSNDFSHKKNMSKFSLLCGKEISKFKWENLMDVLPRE